jgi:uncharacterized membrane protein YphA (DoxX/SURF4 family)
MNAARIIASSIVGVAFLVAGAAKLSDRARWTVEARELGAPRAAVPLLPYVEIVLGASLIAQIAPRLFAALALALLALFTLLVARVLASGRRPACACFGAWSSRPIGAITVVRNAALMVACVAVLV